MKHVILVLAAFLFGAGGFAIAAVGAIHLNVTITLIGAAMTVIAVGLAIPAQLGTAIQTVAPLLPFLKPGGSA